MFGQLPPLFRLWVTVNHWRHMDSSRTISPSIDYLEIPEKEACTAAYHDLTNLMLSQTEEPSLINVSSSRPITDDLFPCGLAVSNEMKALLKNGLLLLCGIRGIKTSSQKTFLLPTRFLPWCPNVWIFMPHLPSCSDLHSPRQCQRSRIRRFQSILLGWKHSQPGLLTPPPCPPLQWSGSITSSKRSQDSSITPQLRTVFRMTLH